jgi:hypothetical protein
MTLTTGLTTAPTPQQAIAPAPPGVAVDAGAGSVDG